MKTGPVFGEQATTVKQAESVKVRIEQLVLAATGASGVVDEDTVRWLGGLDRTMYDRLVAVGLVAERSRVKLGAFVDAYIAERCDVKPTGDGRTL